MFKIIDWYIARTLLSTTVMSLCVLTGLSALIRFIEQMKQVGKGSYDMTVAAIYILLSLPREFEQFFPMSTLIGGLIGMGILASNSELVVMQAAGLSRWNIIVSAMKSALLMVIIVMMVGEWVAPVTEAKAKEIRTQAISGGSLFSSENLVWAKDGENFVSIGEVIDRNNLRDVTVYRFDEKLALQQIISGQQANYDGQAWLLKNVEYTNYLATQISVNNSQDSNRYELALWRKVLQPLTVGVMLLMALSFIFGPLRSVTMGARIIMGVLTGFGFFVSNEVFGTLSSVYQLPPLFGAAFPSAVFAFIAVYLLQRRG